MRDFHFPGRSPVYATNGMAATSHPLAAKVAVETLEAGGNAVDAAIAGAVLLGICEPQMTGIGGDCFALVKPAGEERIVGLNASGRAPSGLDAAKLRAEGLAAMPERGAAAVTIPTAIRGFERLAGEWGCLGLDRLLAPAIRYAEEGVPVAPRVARDWANAVDTLNPDARTHYLLAGKAPTPGALFRAPGQAEVLRRIARDGSGAFYEGEIAEDMLTALTALGGPHTPDDFAAATADDAEPISGRYGDVELVELPPNGQGAAAILLAGILSHFDIASMDPSGAERVHIEAEATKLAYDARDRFIADQTPRLDHLLSSETAASLAALIDPDKAMASAREVSGNVHKETIYITVVDRDRMAVSLIYSIFHSFGSGIASPKFGILLHNRGCGFTLEAGHPNEAMGGKRPMHTIIPGMLKRDGRVMMPFGVMGGAYQANGHARFLSNIVDFGMDPQAAIDAPRSFAIDGELRVERSYGADVAAALSAKGHKVVTPDDAIGGAQAIRMEGDCLVGGSDPRKDGCALGY